MIWISLSLSLMHLEWFHISSCILKWSQYCDQSLADHVSIYIYVEILPTAFIPIHSLGISQPFVYFFVYIIRLNVLIFLFCILAWIWGICCWFPHLKGYSSSRAWKNSKHCDHFINSYNAMKYGLFISGWLL